MPEMNSSGTLTDISYNVYGKNKFLFDVDGVVIIQSKNKDMLVVVTRVRVKINNQFARDDIEGWYNGIAYTYHIGIAYAQGYRVDQIYTGYYDYWEPFNKNSVYDVTNYKLQYQREGGAYYFQNNLLYPNVYYVPDSFGYGEVDRGLLVSATNTDNGWGKTLRYYTGDDIDYENKIITNVKMRDGKTLYARQFPSSLVFEGGVDWYKTDDVDHYDLLDNYGGSNYIFQTRDFSYEYFYGKSMIYINLKANLPKSQTWRSLFGSEDSWAVYSGGYDGMYFSVGISGNSLTITPKNGFYVSQLSGQVFRKNGWGSVKNGPKNFDSVTGVNTIGNVVASLKIGGDATKYVKDFMLVISPIFGNLKLCYYTNLYGQNRNVTSYYNIKTIYFPTRIGSYGENESEPIQTDKISVGGSILYGRDDDLNTKERFYNYLKINGDKISGYGMNIACEFKGVYNITVDKISNYYNNCIFTTNDSEVDENLIYDSTGGVVGEEFIKDELLMINKSIDKTNISKTVYALYESVSYNMTLHDTVYGENATEIAGSPKAYAVMLKNESGDWEKFNLADLNITSFEITAPYYDGSFVLDWIKNYGKISMSGDPSSATYKYFEALSKTTALPAFIAHGYVMSVSNIRFGQYTTYPNTSGGKTTTYSSVIDKNTDTCYTKGLYDGSHLPLTDGWYDPSEYGKVKIDLKGVFGQSTYSVVIDNSDSGCTMFEYPDINGVDEIFDIAAWNSEKVNFAVDDWVDLPNVFGAGYTSETSTTNATFSYVKKLEGFKTENDEILDNVGSSVQLTGLNVMNWDKNGDSVIKLVPVWSEQKQNFNYGIEFSNGVDNIIGDNWDAFIEETVKYSYTNSADTSTNVAETDIEPVSSAERAIASVGVGGVLEVKVKLKSNYYISEVNVSQFTGNKRPATQGLPKSYESVSAKITNAWNKYTNIYYAGYSGNLKKWGIKPENDNLNGGTDTISQSDLKGFFELSYDASGYCVFRF